MLRDQLQRIQEHISYRENHFCMLVILLFSTLFSMAAGKISWIEDKNLLNSQDSKDTWKENCLYFMWEVVCRFCFFLEINARMSYKYVTRPFSCRHKIFKVKGLYNFMSWTDTTTLIKLGRQTEWWDSDFKFCPVYIK